MLLNVLFFRVALVWLTTSESSSPPSLFMRFDRRHRFLLSNLSFPSSVTSSPKSPSIFVRCARCLLTGSMQRLPSSSYLAAMRGMHVVEGFSLSKPTGLLRLASVSCRVLLVGDVIAHEESGVPLVGLSIDREILRIGPWATDADQKRGLRAPVKRRFLPQRSLPGPTRRPLLRFVARRSSSSSELSVFSSGAKSADRTPRNFGTPFSSTPWVFVDNNRRQSQRSTPLVAADLGRESHENLVPRGL